MFCYKSLAQISKVLFEITLLREWENFSCSNTSKNAVRIFIRTISFFSAGRIFRSSPWFRPLFFSGKWCKGKCYFLNHQIFLKDFFRNFSEPFSLSALRSIRVAKVRTYFRSSKSFLKIFFRILSEPFLYHSHRSFNRSGCKGKDFFRICKSFLKIFQKFFRTCFCRFRRCFSLEAGAKIRGFGRHFQIFSGLFFDIFHVKFTPS